MFRSLDFTCPKTFLNYLTFPSFDFEGTRWRLFQSRVDFEGTWWRLFQNCVVHTKLDNYVFIVNICYSNKVTSLTTYDRINSIGKCYLFNYQYALCKISKRELTQFNNVLHIVKLSYLPCLFSFFYIVHYLSYLRPFKTGWYQWFLPISIKKWYLLFTMIVV